MSFSEQLEWRREHNNWVRSIEERVEALEEAIEAPDYPLMTSSMSIDDVRWQVRVVEKEGSPAHVLVRRGEEVIIDTDVDGFVEAIRIAMEAIESARAESAANKEG